MIQINLIHSILILGELYILSSITLYASVRISVFSDQAQEALSQYIALPPLSLKKISIKDNGEATGISYTSDNKFFKGKTETF